MRFTTCGSAESPWITPWCEAVDAQIRSQAETIQLQQEENHKLEDRLAALEALLSGEGHR